MKVLDTHVMSAIMLQLNPVIWKSIREEYMKAWDECERVLTRSGGLEQHKESQHEGVRYQCDECDYIAVLTSTLRKRTKSNNEGV